MARSASPLPRSRSLVTPVLVGMAALGAFVVGAIALPSSARAQIIDEPSHPYPDPDKVARGFFAEAEVGTVVFLGDAGGSLSPGVAVGTRVGYEFFRWVAVQVHGLGSTHTTEFPGRPQDGQLLQLLQGTAELKLTIPIGAWSIFGFGGAGRGRLSTNLLGTAGLTDPGVRVTNVFDGGLGGNYHTASRHFSLGISIAFAKLARVQTTGAIDGVSYLRYTF